MKNLDVKSTITVIVVLTLCAIAVITTCYSLKEPNVDIPEFKLAFGLFTNVVTGVITYFFTKPTVKNASDDPLAQKDTEAK